LVEKEVFSFKGMWNLLSFDKQIKRAVSSTTCLSDIPKPYSASKEIRRNSREPGDGNNKGSSMPLRSESNQLGTGVNGLCIVPLLLHVC
jgi:hypothetical protein